MTHPSAEHHSPYSRDNVRRGILHYLTGRTLSGIASFVSIVLLARHMDLENYAGYAAITGLIMLAAALGELGIGRVISRYVPEGRIHHPGRNLASLIWQTSLLRLAAVVILTFMLYFAWPLIPRYFDAVRLTHFPWALAAYLLANVLFQHFSAVLQALMLQKLLTRVMAIQWGGRLFLILLLIHLYSSITLEQSLWIMAIPELAGAAVILQVIQRHLSHLAAARQTGSIADGSGAWPDWRAVRTLALHNYTYNLLAAPPQGYFMRMLVAALLPAPVVASYGFFMSLVERARQYLPSQLMYNLAEPVIIAGYIKDRDFGKLVQRAQLLYKINLLVMLPFLALALMHGGDIAQLLAPDKFVAYAWLLALFLMQLMIGNHMMPIQLLLNTLGASDALSKSGLISLVAMSVSIAAIMVSGHPLALVFTPLVYEVVNNLTAIFLLQKRGHEYKHPIFFLAKLTTIFVVACGAMWALYNLVGSAPWARLLAASATSTAIFLGGYVLLKILDGADTGTLRLLLPKKYFGGKPATG